MCFSFPLIRASFPSLPPARLQRATFSFPFFLLFLAVITRRTFSFQSGKISFPPPLFPPYLYDLSPFPPPPPFSSVQIEKERSPFTYRCDKRFFSLLPSPPFLGQIARYHRAPFSSLFSFHITEEPAQGFLLFPRASMPVAPPPSLSHLSRTGSPELSNSSPFLPLRKK